MPDVDFTWLFIKMMIVLVVVCGLAVVALKYAVPRWGRFARASGGGTIQVLNRYPLEGRRQLWIVRVGARYFFLGSGDSGVACLAELSAKDIEGPHL